MVIRRQSSLDKINYEAKGQQQMFGRDNIFFKSINLPKPQNFYKLCNNFKLKKIICLTRFSLKVITIEKI